MVWHHVPDIDDMDVSLIAFYDGGLEREREREREREVIGRASVQLASAFTSGQPSSVGRILVYPLAGVRRIMSSHYLWIYQSPFG